MKIFLTLFTMVFANVIFAQTIQPDISEQSEWISYNREVTTTQQSTSKVAHFDAKKFDGLYYNKNIVFENGIIELDIKGKNVLQRSFVGVAFHIQNDSTYNAVYFRPFNFTKPERSAHSVQYISHPEFTWRKLRTDFPEQFENPVLPVPNPDDWFHAKIVVQWPEVTVFVNNSSEPSLQVKMKSNFKKGKIGFWAGFGSDGSYKNLTIIPQ